MAWPKKKKAIIVTSTPTLRLDPGTSLITESGRWRDIEYYYVEKDPGLPNNYFFRNLTVDYTTRQHLGHSDPYSKEKMDTLFRDLPRVNVPYGKVKPIIAVDNIDDLVWASFHIDEAFEWRWLNEDERIYHRLEGGYIGVWLEHLRSGYNPQSHHFLKELCKHEYRIPITQLVPNSVKWIS